MNTHGKIFYAGIGARNTPKEILEEIKKISQRLEKIGFWLRSGGANGADKAFEDGTKLAKEVFKKEDALPWAYDEVAKFMPNENFDFWSMNPVAKSLLARNMQIILGKNGNLPVRFTICWCPTSNYKTTKAGGTGYALRACIHHQIKIFNLYLDTDKELIYNIIKKLEKKG